MGNINGVIEYKNNKYPFILDDRIVKIVGEPFQYFDIFNYAEEIETIKGVTSGNRDIIFLHCKIINNYFTCNTLFSIKGYAISNSNTGCTCDFTYSRSSFKSDAINAFFSPQKALNINRNVKNWTGEFDINITPFNDTTTEFDYLDSKCQLSISRYVNIYDEPTSIGKVESIFAFEHPHIQSFAKIVDDYLALYDFLSFVNYSSNILFDDISISQKNSQGLYEKSATVHIFTNKSEYENSPFNTITFDDIPVEKLSDIFTRVACLRGKDSRLQYYFRENNHDGKYIDPGKWLIMALNFEGLFSTTFPDFKCNTNADFKKAKQLALEKIDSIYDEVTLSKREQEYYQKCRKQIEHYEGLLEEKLNYIIRKNKSILDYILKYNEDNFGVKFSDNYGSIYAEYRNKIAHGMIEPLSDKEIAVYRIIIPIIYLLILSKIDISNPEKKKIIAKLFR